MVTDEEIKKYSDEKYHNRKIQTNLNIHKNLWIDYQRFCLELSKKTRKKITASARVRFLLVKDMLENKG